MADNAAIDTKVQELATQALGSQQPDAGFWSKFAAIILVALYTWYLKSQLEEKEAELAKAMADAANERLDAQQSWLKAQSKVLTDAENLAKQQAAARIKEVEAKQYALDQAVADHVARVKRVESLQSWSDLNALAGVK